MLPDLSVVWVIFFVLLLTVLLDRLLFKPVLRVVEERGRTIASAKELAERSASEARLAVAGFEQKTAAARSELYRQMDEMRRIAASERAEALTRTRAEVEAETTSASQQLAADAKEAKGRLEADAETLGAAIAERILGRQAS